MPGQDFYRGRSVVFAQDDTLMAFCCELISMLDDWSGTGGVLKTDEICSLHFTALKQRLWDLNHWNDSAVSNVFVIGLGD